MTHTNCGKGEMSMACRDADSGKEELFAQTVKGSLHSPPHQKLKYSSPEEIKI